ncbi:NAD-dependent epimerase/dehydratase family protein [Planctomicrobium sp. SH664]|uniref:NAD-dependent epimerase/dehydratase family protein n=1 Tax=Planctomicrobium sp. SH664 TaxID=3448125 RepID=UPI003F5B8B57
MRALVTGGGGFLGRYLVELLLDRGEEVRIFSRGSYPELSAQGVDVQQGDLRDAAAVERAVSGMDSVFHVAALPGIWGKWEMFHGINTRGTGHVLQACLKHNVRKLIYTSSPSVVYDGQTHLDADETLPYPARYLCHYPHSKAIAEREVLAANGQQGLLTMALRPHLIWGPRDNHLIPRLIHNARAGKIARIGDGHNLISMSYVENTAAAHLQAHDALNAGARCAGEAYFVNELQPVRLWDWIDELLALAGLPPLQRTVSARTAYCAGAMLEAIFTCLRLSGEPRMTRFLALQLSQSHTYSTEKARRDFGYQPVVSYAEAMRRITPDLQRLGGRS